MAAHRAAIRAAAVVSKVRHSASSSSPRSLPSRRSTPTEAPSPGLWVNPYPRESRYSSAAKAADSPPLALPKPPFVELMDPAVFCHPSRTGDPRVFRFERPENDATKWDRRVESFEKLEHFGKSLLRMTLIELVTNHYASLSVPAIEALVNKLLSDAHLVELSDHYSLSSWLVADPLATETLRLSSAVKTSLFYAYVAGIYHQEGMNYASQWVRQCFRNGLDEEYRTMKKELFPKDALKDELAPQAFNDELAPQRPPSEPPRPIEPDHLAASDTSNDALEEPMDKEDEEKFRNQNPLMPEVMPLVQLTNWFRQEKLPPPTWNYAVKGSPPDLVFRAELTLAGRTVQALGRKKSWARQTAAAVYLGIKDINPNILERAVQPIALHDYTPRLFEVTEQLGLPRPVFKTVTNPKDPHYKCTLDVAGSVFVCEGLGKVAMRREAARQALEQFDTAFKTEARLFDHLQSQRQSVSFAFSINTEDATLAPLEGEMPWKCRITIRDQEHGAAEAASVFAKGKNKFFARREAIRRAAEMLKLDKEPVGEEKTATEADYTTPEAESATEATKQSPKVEVQ